MNRLSFLGQGNKSSRKGRLFYDHIRVGYQVGCRRHVREGGARPRLRRRRASGDAVRHGLAVADAPGTWKACATRVSYRACRAGGTAWTTPAPRGCSGTWRTSSFKADLEACAVHWNTRCRQKKLKGLTPEEFRNQSLMAA